MRIYIVENEAHHSEHLCEQIKHWTDAQQLTATVSVHQSGELFLSEFEHDADLVFLDIQMDGMDGMAVAHSLRAAGYKKEIVFLTSFSEYVFDGYTVRALNYYLKPIQEKQVAFCLEYIQKRLRDCHYIYRDRNEIIKIPYADIISFAAQNHHIGIITTEKIYKQSEKLRNILGRLPADFHPCHRSIIINLDHVLMLRGSELVMSNQQILPISKSNLEQIRAAVIAYANKMR